MPIEVPKIVELGALDMAVIARQVVDPRTKRLTRCYWQAAMRRCTASVTRESKMTHRYERTVLVVRVVSGRSIHVLSWVKERRITKNWR